MKTPNLPQTRRSGQKCWRWADILRSMHSTQRAVGSQRCERGRILLKSAEDCRKISRWQLNVSSDRHAGIRRVVKRPFGSADGLGSSARSQPRPARMLAGWLSPRECRPARAAPAARGSPCPVIAHASRDHTATHTHKHRLCSACFLSSARLAPPWPGPCACVPRAVCPNPRVCARAGSFWWWSCRGVAEDEASFDRSTVIALRDLGLQGRSRSLSG